MLMLMLMSRLSSLAHKLLMLMLMLMLASHVRTGLKKNLNKPYSPYSQGNQRQCYHTCCANVFLGMKMHVKLLIVFNYWPLGRFEYLQLQIFQM